MKRKESLRAERKSVFVVHNKKSRKRISMDTGSFSALFFVWKIIVTNASDFYIDSKNTEGRL